MSASAYLEPGTVVGEYRIEHKLGQGGMGEVYAARHPLIGKRAAIKVIRPELSADEEALSLGSARVTARAAAMGTAGTAGGAGRILVVCNGCTSQTNPPAIVVPF